MRFRLGQNVGVCQLHYFARAYRCSLQRKAAKLDGRRPLHVDNVCHIAEDSRRFPESRNPEAKQSVTYHLK